MRLGAAISLLSGRGSADGAVVNLVKRGEFKILDISHANKVVAITDWCKNNRIKFATQTSFVHAVSMAIRIPEFDVELFKARVKTSGHVMNKRGTEKEYLEELENLYNYRSRKIISLKIKAEEISRSRRSATYRNQTESQLSA